MKNSSDISLCLDESFPASIFPEGYELVPNIKEVYELQLAFYESKLMSDDELIRNGAYFSNINGKFTRHFQMCAGESLKLPDHSSSRLKSFFESNIFRTGYGTHGLFPYRGKFHPQMIKGLINIMGLQPGDTVLDPMMGSGTVPVEACLMGIHSIGVDASPFCQFMSQTKIDALSMPLDRAERALGNVDEVFDYFLKKIGHCTRGEKTSQHKNSYFQIKEDAQQYLTKMETENGKARQRTSDTEVTYNLLLLAYLDSVGYAERSKRKTAKELFKGILERYLFVCKKAQKAICDMDMEVGRATVSTGDARNLDFDADSIDGIIFSPPYSFAIDYLENDSFHLDFFGVDAGMLREQMIGLRGGRLLTDKYMCYKDDMESTLKECSRVLRNGSLCSIVIGTNDNQLSKALKIPKEKVKGLHELTVELGQKYGFKLARLLERSIQGISNTMRKEYIVMLQKR